MIDPHLMLLLMQILGKEYLVWDKAADIEFIKASKRKVRTVIKISDKNLEDIALMTEGGEKYFPEFMLDVIDEDNELVARVKKTIYVKKKKSRAQVVSNVLDKAA